MASTSKGTKQPDSDDNESQSEEMDEETQSPSSGKKSASGEDKFSSLLKKKKISTLVSNPWDPSLQANVAHIAPWALLRMKRDIMEFFRDPPPGIFIVPDETDLTLVHVMMIGPEETPYQNGFFNFMLRFPSDYPLKAPRVKFLTTSAGEIRFNPNLYNSGKVCLSILGTWNGPQWSAAQSLTSLLLSIRSILNENPYFNEPGYENASQKAADDYNILIRYETHRVAVIEAVNHCLRELPGWPQPICEKILDHFLKFYSGYEETARANEKLDGRQLTDPFSKSVVHVKYRTLGKQLQQIKEKVLAKKENQNEVAGTSEGAESQDLYFRYVDRLAKSGKVPDKALYDDSKYERKPEENNDDFFEFMEDDDTLDGDDSDEEA